MRADRLRGGRVAGVDGDRRVLRAARPGRGARAPASCHLALARRASRSRRSRARAAPRLASRHTLSARGSWRASVHGGLRFASPFKVDAASGADEEAQRLPGGDPGGSGPGAMAGQRVDENPTTSTAASTPTTQRVAPVVDRAAWRGVGGSRRRRLARVPARPRRQPAGGCSRHARPPPPRQPAGNAAPEARGRAATTSPRSDSASTEGSTSSTPTERHRQVDQRDQPEVAQHRDARQREHAEAGDRGDPGGEHRRSGGSVGARQRLRRRQPGARAPAGSARTAAR